MGRSGKKEAPIWYIIYETDGNIVFGENLLNVTKVQIYVQWSMEMAQEHRESGFAIYTNKEDVVQTCDKWNRNPFFPDLMGPVVLILKDSDPVGFINKSFSRESIPEIFKKFWYNQMFNKQTPNILL